MTVSINPFGSEILVNSPVSGDQTDARITLLASGGFVVTWTDASQGAGGAGGDISGLAVKAQLFDASSQPVGGEFLVNSTTNGDQANARVTALANGGFVVTWSSTSSSDSQVMAQVFDALGGSLGAEISLSAPDPSNWGQQAEPEIVALSDGGFVAAWQAAPSVVGDAGSIVAQHFDASGQPLDGPTIVAATTSGDPTNPQIAALSNGGYVVVWQDGMVRAQTYAADGTPTSGEIPVSSQEVGLPTDAKVAALDSGWFAITWEDQFGSSSDNSGSAVMVQLFDATGAAQSPPILANSAISGDQTAPQVVRLTNGGFVIVWQDNSQGDGGASGDTSGWAIKAQVFDANGAAIGNEILVNTTVDGDQTDPQITALDNGGFAVAWQDASQEGGDPSGLAIRAQAFDSEGHPIGAEQLVNSTTPGDQSDPHIQALTNGAFAVTWTDGSDGSGSSIKAQVFDVAGDQYVLWTGAASDLWSDGRNWSDGITPGSADSVTLADAFHGALIASDTAVGGLYGDFAGRALTLSAHLDITGTSDYALGLVTGSLVFLNGAVLTIHATAEFGDVSSQRPGGALVVDAGSGGLATIELNGANLYMYGAIDILSGTLKLESGVVKPQSGGNVLSETLDAKVILGSGAAGSGATLELDGGLSSPVYLEQGATLVLDAQGSLNGNVFVEGDATIDLAGSTGLGANFIFSKLGETIDLRPGSGQTLGYDGVSLTILTPVSTTGSIENILGVHAGWTSDQSLPSNVFLSVTDDGTGGKLVSLAERNSDAPAVRIGGETIDLNKAETGDAVGSSQVVRLTNGGFAVVDEVDGAGLVDVRAAVFDSTGAAIVRPDGSTDFVVSATDADMEMYPTITAMVGGGFAVAWWVLPAGASSGSYDYKIAVFNNLGQQVGTETSIVTKSYPYLISQQQITALPDGYFAMTWVEHGSSSRYFIRAELFNAFGQKILAPGESVLNSGESALTVNTSTTPYSSAIPEIPPNQVTASLTNGSFVVIWRDIGAVSASADESAAPAPSDTSGTALKGQIIKADGEMVGGEFLVNTDTAGNQDNAQVVALDARDGGGGPNQAQTTGAFVVVWDEDSNGDYNYNVRAQIFTEQGVKSGGELTVNTMASGAQAKPVIAALYSGGFVVVWEEWSPATWQQYTIKAQIYSHSGYKVGGEFQVNTATDAQNDPQVTELPNGGFVVTWTESSQGVGGAPGDQTGEAVKAQVFSASGDKIGGEILVNTTTSNDQFMPRVEMLTKGDFVITWFNGNSNYNGNVISVRSQVFSSNWVAETWVSGSAGDWSTSTNWARGAAPGNGDDVTIHAGEADLNANTVVNTLTIDGDSAKLRLSGQLGVTQAATIDDGTLEIVDGGVLRAAEGLVLAAPLGGGVGGMLIADIPAAVATVYAQIENDGAITATAGKLILHGAMAGAGGQLKADGGTIDVDGAVSGAISAAIADGGVLQLDATATLGTVRFGKGGAGTLAIGDLASTSGGIQHQDFTGVIAGFGLGDAITISTSHLGSFGAITDIRTLAFDAATHTTQLVLFDGAGEVGALTFKGDYSVASFALTPPDWTQSFYSVSMVGGVAIDGYIEGATVFADANNNGVLDAGEVSAITDAQGAFVLSGGSGPLVLFGGVDTSTGLNFTGTMQAPSGYSVISPLSTLVAAQLTANPTATDIEAAEQKVLAAFGVTLSSDQSLATLDPVAGALASDPAATAAFVADAKIADTVTMLGAALSGATGANTQDATANVIKALVQQIVAGQPLDLTDASNIGSLLAAADQLADPGNAHPISAEAVVAIETVVRASNLLIDTATNSDAVVRIEGVAQGATTQALQDLPANADTTQLNALIATYTGDQLTQAVDTYCFMAGTMIRTPDGEAAIETLRRGDLVLTAEGAAKPVNWLGRQTISTRFADPLRVLPIRVREGALGENAPSRDLLVSPDHALLVSGVLVQAGALVNGASIVREANVPEIFVYYHVELDDHSLILAENTPAETFVDNVDRLNFDNWAEFEALYPHGKAGEELPYPRAKSRRQVPAAMRAELADRAMAIGRQNRTCVVA